jgi:UPF0716 protein FxsA
MVSRLFLVYALVELTVVVALASAIGFGRTLLLLLAVFVGGVALAGAQLKRQITRLRSDMTAGEIAVGDSALVALGTVLVVVPGLVTSAAGLLLLLPPVRAAARPILTAMAIRGIGWRAPLITVTTVGANQWAGRSGQQRPHFIDGEVIDVTDVEPPALPD